MTQAISPQVGFLTIVQEAAGHQGGYLLTNSWGRPLEFRLSSAVQPNRVQQILYGGTLMEYLHAELIGKTLIEKTATTTHLVVTDCAAVLALRTLMDLPVLLLLPRNEEPSWVGKALTAHEQPGTGGVLYRETRFADDAERVERLLAGLDGSFDLSEPFARVREAMTEARKMGGGNRGAA